MARQQDSVDRVLDQWHSVRPDLDPSPIAVIGRVSRLSRLIDRRLAENFGRHGIEDWMYDVLATLYRAGEPWAMTAGELVRQTMVTTGAITNRIDRLEARGLVRRTPGADRRTVIVELTADGRTKVEDVVGSHLALERELLGPLSPRQEQDLVTMLRSLLVALGDEARPRS